MTEIKNYICDLMKTLDFPSDAQNTFASSLDKIIFHKNACSRFESILKQYEKTEKCPYNQMLSEAIEIGKALGIHEYTISLLLFLCMSKKLHSRYLERGLSEDVYYNSVKDLKYKLNECRLVYGIDGSFVAPWFQGFFELTRFALCRLQFEVFSTRYEYVFNGNHMPVGSKVVNMHIPRTGTKLDHEEVLESYRMAEKMFAHEFNPEPIIFLCDSWLLDPWIPTVLPPSSNLCLFQNDFQIVKTGESYNYEGLWSVFDCFYTGDVSKLPSNSTLRKAYIERIKNNQPFYYGHGLFLYKNGEIISQSI